MKSFTLIIILVCPCYFAEKPNDGLNFGLDLLHFTQLKTNGHLVISPFGVWSLMAGLALGADGESYNQISQTFKLPSDHDALTTEYKRLANAVQDSASDGVTLINKNFMFLDNNFNVNTEFKNALENDFGATIKELDFDDPNSVKIANELIQDTGATSSDVIRSDDFAGSRMILTNVISFRGLWGLPFSTSDTREEPFYDENLQVIGSVNMMYQQGEFPFTYFIDLKFNAVELPYGTTGKYSMLIVIPYPKTSVHDLYEKTKGSSLEDIFAKLEYDIDEFGLEAIHVSLPRFKINTNVPLNQPLSDMNVVDIFQPGLANFKKMTNNNVVVSSIIHMADIEVTESGTVASAVSEASIMGKMQPPKVVLNRPFAYFIVEKSTLSMIFGGIYSIPSLF